ncbi:sensor histidine kinase [Fulvivirga lutea]|uniref:histidine kinase n=1 Tax=Fulvivirga lutea TaxID=2810512 RepID=A0A975A215_9BACT|nr:HAMP domain-containing sensor histidine kinase [Fulvivirga lutea]QSE98815.1 HAMP domain-containing histidine kinase [Fulvivirga lutea]
MTKTKNMGLLNHQIKFPIDSLEEPVSTFEENYIRHLKGHLSGYEPNINMVKVDVSAHLNRAVIRAKKYLDTSRISISQRVKGAFTFYSYPDYFQFILNQIIENGIIYYDQRKTNSFLDIELNIEKEKLFIDVIDNGIGVPKEHIPNIFTCYFRLSHKSKGFGIGLALVKQFVEEMNGSIYFDSAFQVGSHLKIQLPNMFHL